MGSASGSPKRFRGRELSHFVRGENGELIYNGPHVRYDGSIDRWRSLLTRLWILGGGGLLFCMASGMLPYSTSRAHFHVFLSYAAALITQVVLVWKLGRASDKEGRLRSYVFEETLAVIPRLALVSLVFHALHLLALAFDAASGVILGSLSEVVASAVCCAVSILCLVGLFRMRKSLVFREENEAV